MGGRRAPGRTGDSLGPRRPPNKQRPAPTTRLPPIQVLPDAGPQLVEPADVLLSADVGDIDEGLDIMSRTLTMPRTNRAVPQYRHLVTPFPSQPPVQPVGAVTSVGNE